ncbi:hypothetical protein K431DRAFT_228141 [Polychaeton citri CBS 116435]|uniref:Zn(2)-C6 fungal-type domain-containing protein n=1 Tax=Polychaeton citri CBS 116435 TaxID=1314669 RepID=A0A9P4UNS4_9PEZI|nr:hypothetical protein K431DRAFT_228141 [Polychaeton citri CBS 116435]
MPGTGAGPSRRSHTKSRKGCKTCKRRHIRCDETFPQCRNCTKHQVRCDYMESYSSDNESQNSPEQAQLVMTPGTESRIDVWQQTGSFPYPDLQVYPPPQTQEYSRTELRLIHHLSTASNDLLLNGSSNLTLWTQKMPKFLSIASSYPYVMHALLSFSANHLAWVHSSNETRSLHIQHGGIALRGLHEAIGNFSHANADAVLAASLLMLWQATDWRSWSSLRAGIQSVLSAMQQWKHESIFAEFIAEEDLVVASYRTHRRRSSLNPTDRGIVLQNTTQSLQRLKMSLNGHDLESSWVDQLLAYLYRLQASKSPSSPEEQFSQLYMLRKWLFWVPVSLLQRNGGQGPAMLTLAHFYATALQLEPLFPDLGSSFCSSMALPPLEAIISVTDAMSSSQGLDTAAMEIAAVMTFPRQAALNYRSQALQFQQQFGQQEPMLHINPDTLSYTSVGNLSPAFAPSQLHYGSSGQQTPSSASTSHSPFLEVPTSQAGFSYGTSQFGAMPSPGFGPQTYPAQESNYYQYGGMPTSGFRGGFVAPAPIWT